MRVHMVKREGGISYDIYDMLVDNVVVVVVVVFLIIHVCYSCVGIPLIIVGATVGVAGISSYGNTSL